MTATAAPDAGADARAEARNGFAIAAAGFLWWGFVPAFWKLLTALPVLDLVLYRTLASAAFLALLVTGLGRWRALNRQLFTWRLLAPSLVTAVLIGGNWLIYIFAINSGQVLETALGYYINPLVSVLLGFAFLGERLTPLQWLSVAIAAAGVVVLALGLGLLPWIALGLALAFGFYGLVRKKMPIDAILGLTVETFVLSPLAVLALAGLAYAHGGVGAAAEPQVIFLLACSGIVTTVPLMCFAAGVRRLRYVTIGIMQYSAPTITAGLAVWGFGEPFTGTHAITFLCIWTAVALYSWDSWRRARARSKIGSD
jgi:chloramphenicol-sensitive protein RarD